MRPTARPGVEPVDGLPVRLAKIDRFWLPVDERGILRYYLRNLFVAHGLRERGWHLLRRATPGPLVSRILADDPRTVTVGPQRFRLAVDHGVWETTDLGSAAPDLVRLKTEVEIALELLDRLAERLPSGDGKPLRWILAEDYSRIEKIVLYLFPSGGSRPSAILKVAPAGASDPGPAGERQTLADLRQRLPPELARTLPEPLDFVEGECAQALLLSALRGRPAYTEMRSSWLPGYRCSAHFREAARWLSRFHAATRKGVQFAPALEPRGAAGETAVASDWLERLREQCAASPIALAAGHGDFWPRNLLLEAGRADGALPGVVDWEDYRPAAPPFEDLFRFPLSYGLSFPWVGYRRLPAPEAFRRTFIDDNRLSRAVRGYFRFYCSRTGLRPDLLAPLFRYYLLAGATADDATARDRWRGLENEEADLGWTLFRIFSRADRTALSG